MSLFAVLLAVYQLLIAHQDWHDSYPYRWCCVVDDLGADSGAWPGRWTVLNVAVLLAFYVTAMLSLFGASSTWAREWSFIRPGRLVEKRWTAWKKLAGAKDRTLLKQAWQISILLIYLAALTPMISFSVLLSSSCIAWLGNSFWISWGMFWIHEDLEVPKRQADGDEKGMGFGQIVPIILLATTVPVFLQAYHGKFPTLKSVKLG